MSLAMIHLLVMIPAFARLQLPLLLPSYSTFDDLFPFFWWGVLSLVAFLLLMYVPTRVPLGLISSLFSAAVMFAIGAEFSISAGLIFGSTIFFGLGMAAMALFMRSLWMHMTKVGWFQRRVMKGGNRG